MTTSTWSRPARTIPDTIRGAHLRADRAAADAEALRTRLHRQGLELEAAHRLIDAIETVVAAQGRMVGMAPIRRLLTRYRNSVLGGGS